MNRKGLSMAVIGLLVLLLGMGGAAAQEPKGDIGAQDAVGTASTYQGRLTATTAARPTATMIFGSDCTMSAAAAARWAASPKGV